MKSSEIHEWYILYFKRLVLFAHQYMNDMDTSQDIVQDVFINLYNKEIHRLENPKAFLYTATKNRCLDHLKTQNIRSKHHEFLQKRQSDHFFEDTIETVELESYLMEIIDALPHKCQEIFIKSRFDGKSNAEISEELNISKRTVETQISNALKKIKQSFEDFKSMIWTFF